MADLRRLEERLLTPAVRSSRTELDALISADFREFGSSGRIWSKSDVLRELPDQESVGDAFVSEFEPRVLSDGCVLVTYRLRLGADESLRSSVWRREGDRWRVIFHQGTRAGGDS